MHTFQHYRSLFQPLYNAVKELGKSSTLPDRGHGLAHDVAVAMTGVQLAGNKERAAEKVFVAGLIHSTDYRVPKEKVERTLDSLLLHLPHSVYFSEDEVAEVKEAVLRHQEFKDKNLFTRKETQRLLMDADKLVNMNILHVALSGQAWPTVPTIELEYIGLRNPKSTYKSPSSIIEDQYGAIEWTEHGWFHLPEAHKRAEKLAEKLHLFIRDAEAPYIELGLAGVKL